MAWKDIIVLKEFQRYGFYHLLHFKLLSSLLFSIPLATNHTALCHHFHHLQIFCQSYAFISISHLKIICWMFILGIYFYPNCFLSISHLGYIVPQVLRGEFSFCLSSTKTRYGDVISSFSPRLSMVSFIPQCRCLDFLVFLYLFWL